MSFLLQFTNRHGEKYFFCNLGQQWPYLPSRRLIERTSTQREQGRVFATPEEANDVMVIAGNPTRKTDDNSEGWEIVPV